MSSLATGSARPELPPSKVYLNKEGRVVQVETWTLWNGEPWCTIDIGLETNPNVRARGEYFAHIGSPEHGGGSVWGSLEQVLAGLHPEIQKQYLQLFGFEKPDQSAVDQLGFRGYRIQEAAA